nr:reverse transcriptase domain-containing protein [Tanacetum cinerariifolium]
MTAEGNGDLPVPDLRTMKELCQPSLNGRGGPIAPIAIQETNFGLKNDMIQQSIKVNGVTDDALRLYLFAHSLTHHATAWRNLHEKASKECYDLIENMTTHHNDWDTSAQRSESSSSITSSFDTEIAALKAKMAEINKNLMRVLQVNQQVKAVTPNCETYGGPHSFSDCPATIGNTQNVYATGACQVKNSFQFHGLSGDDANKHLDKFLHVTQSIKVNGVIDDALCLYLFPHSLTHHATAWFNRFPRNSINTCEQMAKIFLGKYFPPSMMTKLRNEITNFCQCLDESLFEA